MIYFLLVWSLVDCLVDTFGKEKVDPKTYIDQGAADNGEQAPNDTDNDCLDYDPTARSCDNDFYQNVEDRCHFRDEK